jgi:hypothetical protein
MLKKRIPFSGLCGLPRHGTEPSAMRFGEHSRLRIGEAVTYGILYKRTALLMHRNKQGSAYYWGRPRVSRTEEPSVGETIKKNVVPPFLSHNLDLSIFFSFQS